VPRIVSATRKAFPERSVVGLNWKGSLAASFTPSIQASLYGPRRYTSTKPQLSRDDIQNRVVSICKNFDKITADKLTLESNFMSDLGLDSLDHVELIMAFEDEFGFEISDSDAEKLLRPSDIVKYVQQRQLPDPEANPFPW
jgi:acyl carrier protein